MHAYLAQLIVITIIATALIHIPIWVIAISKKVLKPVDFACPFIPAIIWLILTAFGIGSVSMTNVFEIPIVMLITVLACVILYFGHFDSLRTKNGRTLILVFLLIFVFLLRIFMPELPA